MGGETQRLRLALQNGAWEFQRLQSFKDHQKQAARRAGLVRASRGCGRTEEMGSCDVFSPLFASRFSLFFPLVLPVACVPHEAKALARLQDPPFKHVNAKVVTGKARPNVGPHRWGNSCLISSGAFRMSRNLAALFQRRLHNICFHACSGGCLFRCPVVVAPVEPSCKEGAAGSVERIACGALDGLGRFHVRKFHVTTDHFGCGHWQRNAERDREKERWQPRDGLLSPKKTLLVGFKGTGKPKSMMRGTRKETHPALPRFGSGDLHPVLARWPALCDHLPGPRGQLLPKRHAGGGEARRQSPCRERSVASLGLFLFLGTFHG